MFERFTDRSRRVVVLAQEEARLLNHNYIGTEHILLGLLHEEHGVAAQALTAMGVDLDDVRAKVEDIVGEGEKSPSGHIPFTPRAKKVLELSLRESLQLGHNYIGTEHILLALIREGEGIAAKVLANLGADLHDVRTTVINILSVWRNVAQERAQESPDTSIALRVAQVGLSLVEAGNQALRSEIEGGATLNEEVLTGALHDLINLLTEHRQKGVTNP